MKDNNELSNVEFVVPNTQHRCLGLNASSPGYRKRLALCRGILLFVCVALGITGCVMSLAMGVLPKIVGITLAAVCICVVATTEWLWHRIEFCNVCGASTKAVLASRNAWCPGCYNLIDPTQIIVGTPGIFELIGPEYLCHDDPIPRFLALATLRAIRDGARKIHFEPEKDAYRLSVTIGDNVFELEEPPLFIHLAAAQTIRAIAGMSMADWNTSQHGRMEVRLTGKTVPTDIAVEPTDHGQRIVLTFAQ